MLRNRNRKQVLLKLPISAIRPNPYQPRKEFDEYELRQLAESIRQNGLLQPLSVRVIGSGYYELIAGERRLRACKLAGLTEVPCLLHEVDDQQSALFSLIENLQRKDLSMFEEAEGIYRLIKLYGLSQFEAAEKLGMAQSTLANKLRLLRLTSYQRERITAAQLTERHARALLRISDPELRDKALNTIIADQLNVQESEELIDSMLNGQTEQLKPSPKRTPIINDVRLFINSISKLVDSIKKSGLDAKTVKSETDEYIEYTVTISKHPSKKVV
ncbi:MAG TPA: ParB/RepB/Spo0J family partition protein [Clostridiales bacterium]|nr:ParB/RepB/Spo0J family partition protein [Clostridiales bacterium]